VGARARGHHDRHRGPTEGRTREGRVHAHDRLHARELVERVKASPAAKACRLSRPSVRTRFPPRSTACRNAGRGCPSARHQVRSGVRHHAARAEGIAVRDTAHARDVHGEAPGPGRDGDQLFEGSFWRARSSAAAAAIRAQGRGGAHRALQSRATTGATILVP
jgi:hypothetical protein